MKNITLSTGGETYCFNNDENRTVTINLTDPNLPARFEQGYAKIDELMKSAKEGDITPEKLMQLDTGIKALLDKAFNAPVSAAAFGGMSVFTPVGDSVLFVEFANKFIPEIEAQVQKLGGQLRAKQITLDGQKLKKYTAPYEPAANTVKTARKGLELTEEQKAYCRQLMEEMMQA